MGTNKVASVVLLDVSQSMGSQSDNGESFFERSLSNLKKMVLRKMFSQDNDELGIILFGSDDTDNSQARGSLYQNIRTFSPVSLPTWDLYRRIEAIEMSSLPSSDWIEAVVVAVDFMKSEIEGRKFRDKQIVVFSNCSGDTSSDEETISPILNVIEGENIKFIVVGNDMEEEYNSLQFSEAALPKSLQLIYSAVTKLGSGVHLSFFDIEKEFEYFEKKRKMERFYKVNLIMGSNIQLPVRWMKVTKEETRFKWFYPPKPSNEDTTQSKSSSKPVKYVTDEIKKTNFGCSLVELSYADIEAMKRNTGPPSFYYMGCVKSTKVPRSMFVGNDVYVVVADKDARSVSMFSALVDALIKAGKYGIARRIASKNGKIVVGALLPVSDDLGKAMYFLKLPFKDWVKRVPEKHLVEAKNEEGLKAISDLIDSSMLPEDLLEEGKGLLVRDPTFQSRCHALSLRAQGRLPEYSLPDYPESLRRILEPVRRSEAAKEALARLAEIFPSATAAKGGAPTPREDGGARSEGNRSAAGPIKVEDKKELEDILNMAGDEYDDTFSEEMFSDEDNKIKSEPTS